jgi:toxin FitB
MYLLDTNVLSETRKPRPHPAVLAWIRSVPEGSLYLAAVTLGELQEGVEITRQQDTDQANEITGWIDLISSGFEILPAGELIFREWARLMKGRFNPSWERGLIAATARVHRLVVVTRYVKDFDPFGVELLNPFNYRKTESD